MKCGMGNSECGMSARASTRHVNSAFRIPHSAGDNAELAAAYYRATETVLEHSRDLVSSGIRHVAGGAAVDAVNYADLQDTFGENYYGWDSTVTCLGKCPSSAPV